MRWVIAVFIMSASSRLQVAVVGCGLIGRRRAEHVARQPESECCWVVDVRPEAAKKLGEELHCRWDGTWEQVMRAPSIDVVVVSTVNRWIKPIACAALEAGKHVLIEKPMGRNLMEAREIASVAHRSGALLKIGFNHRYHPALQEAQRLLQAGRIGRPLFIRAVYGHGGRVGYDQEWRTDPEESGGGELLDQGVHIVDLMQWFFGVPGSVCGRTPRYVWAVERVEDNAFGLFSWPDGRTAQLHTSWTQWKNRFEFQIYGDRGALEVAGLGGSYGPETLTQTVRAEVSGAPTVHIESFQGEDGSWQLEWEEFVWAIRRGSSYLGTPADGLAAMRMIDALYRASQEGHDVQLQS